MANELQFEHDEEAVFDSIQYEGEESWAPRAPSKKSIFKRNGLFKAIPIGYEAKVSGNGNTYARTYFKITGDPAKGDIGKVTNTNIMLSGVTDTDPPRPNIDQLAQYMARAGYPEESLAKQFAPGKSIPAKKLLDRIVKEAKPVALRIVEAPWEDNEGNERPGHEVKVVLPVSEYDSAVASETYDEPLTDEFRALLNSGGRGSSGGGKSKRTTKKRGSARKAKAPEPEEDEDEGEEEGDDLFG